MSDAWHPQINGVVRTYEYLQAELVKLGHEVKVIGPADFSIRMPMPGYSEIQLVLAPAGRLSRLINDFRPHHIHIATEGPLGIAGRRHCKKQNVPFTTSYHTQFPDYIAQRIGFYLPFLYKPFYEFSKRFMHWFHAPASAILIATPSLQTQLREWGFTMPMYPFSRGANLDLFYPGEKNIFNEIKRPVALYVGRIAIEKNLEDFLSMPWSGSKVLVGEGPSKSLLSQKYPQAIFLGKRVGRDLADCYRSADLFVFPSRTDTFGIVLVEALASGLPVAAYDVTGPRDIIIDPFLGALHESDLGAAALKALQDGDPERRSHHVKTHYTWENAGRQFENAIKNYCTLV